MNKNNKIPQIGIVVWLSLAIVFHLLGWWMKHNAAVYTLYFKYLYLPLARLKHVMFGWLPFAFGDLVYFVLIALAVYLLIGLIVALFRKTKRTVALERFIRFAVLVYVSFLLLWGYNYQKPSVIFPKQEQESPVSIIEPNLIDEIILLDQIIDRINDLRINIQWFERDDEYATAAVRAYQQFNAAFTVAPLKVSLLGRHIYKLGVSGYFNPLTGEGHMIPDLPQSSYGFVYLHEMAHQIGVASESEANLVAYMIALQSDETIFHYTALLRIYRQLYGRIYLQEAAIARLMDQRLVPEIKQDLLTAKMYPLSHHFSIRKYSMGVYEQYLKRLGHTDGLSAYGKLFQEVVYCQQQGIGLGDILWQYY